jgi:hypothetical protein
MPSLGKRGNQILAQEKGTCFEVNVMSIFREKLKTEINLRINFCPIHFYPEDGSCRTFETLKI